MGARVAFGLFAPVLFWTWACTPGGPSFVDASVLDADYAFLVLLRGSGVVQAHGAFDLERAGTVEIQDADELLMVGLREEDLLAASEIYEPGQPGGISMKAERPDLGCPFGKLFDENRIQIPLPRSAQVLRLDPDNDFASGPAPMELIEALFGEVRLGLPIRHERCTGTTSAELRPFASELVPINEALEIEGVPLGVLGKQYSAILRVSEERVLASVKNFLFLLERGQPFSAQPGRYLGLGPARVATAFAMAEMATSTGSASPTRRVVASAVVASGSELTGAILEIRLGPGGLESVSTSTALDVPVEDLLLDPENGRLLAVAQSGTVLIQEQVGEPFERIRIVEESSGNPASISLTGRSDPRYAISGYEKGWLFMGDRRGRVWRLVTDGLEPTVRYDGLAGGLTADGPELLTAGNAGRVFRLAEEGDHFEALDPSLHLPPSFSPCGPASSTCGWIRASIPYRTIALARTGGAERMFLGFNGCTAVVSARLDGQCASYLPAPGELRGFAPEEDKDYRLTDARYGWLTVASLSGELLEAELSP